MTPSIATRHLTYQGWLDMMMSEEYLLYSEFIVYGGGVVLRVGELTGYKKYYKVELEYWNVTI